MHKEWSVVVVLSVLLFCVGIAGAAVISVPSDQPSISAGITAAGNGDTVLIADGTYTGTDNKDLSFQGKSITVKSENGAGACVIDCEDEGRGFEFVDGESSSSVLDGVTILNGDPGLYEKGGGIFVFQATPTIMNCTITGCSAYNWGGGLYCYEASPAITECVFTGNSARVEGGAVCTDDSSPSITNCIFSQNFSGTYGGAVTILYGSPVISGSTFAENSSSMAGGAVITSDTTAVIIGNDFIDNFSLLGGGIGCFNDIYPTIGGSAGNGNYFEGNHAGSGADLFSENIPSPTIDARFNDFAGYYPSDYYVSPQEAFNLSSSVSGLTPVTSDVYVSPSGSDLNDGLSWMTAFRTVRHAISRVYGTSGTPVVVHLAEGTYSPSATGEVFPLALMDWVSIDGAGRSTSIIGCRIDESRLDRIL